MIDWKKFIPKVDLIAELQWRGLRLSIGTNKEQETPTAEQWFAQYAPEQIPTKECN